jgi:hypothetical protein
MSCSRPQTANRIADESARCNGANACVEVARIAPGSMGVRDSESTDTILVFERDEWRAFRQRVRSGEHDLPH